MSFCIIVLLAIKYIETTTTELEADITWTEKNTTLNQQPPNLKPRSLGQEKKHIHFYWVSFFVHKQCFHDDTKYCLLFFFLIFSIGLIFLASYFLFTSIEIWINKAKLKRREERELLKALIFSLYRYPQAMQGLTSFSITGLVAIKCIESTTTEPEAEITWTGKKPTYICLVFPSSCISNASTLIDSIDSFFIFSISFIPSSKLFLVYL